MKLDRDMDESAGIDWLEYAAVAASLLCLAHCLALPLVLAALPTLAGVLPVSESVHFWILGFALPAAAITLVSGWNHHKVQYPFVLGGLGLLLMAIGAFAFGHGPLETPVTVLGSLLLAGAHVANWRLRHYGHAH